jgi:hypothetical protein
MQITKSRFFIGQDERRSAAIPTYATGRWRPGVPTALGLCFAVVGHAALRHDACTVEKAADPL